MRINTDLVRARLDEHDDAVIRERNEDSLQLIESAVKAVNNVMYELRPPMLDEYGLIASLKRAIGSHIVLTVEDDGLGFDRQDDAAGRFASAPMRSAALS